MKSTDLAELLHVTRQAIEKKRDKAIESGENWIEINNKKFSFSREKGHYRYEEILHKEIKVKVSNSKAERKYLQYPLEKRKEAELRLALVREYEHRRGLSYERWVEQLAPRFGKLRFSRRQFERWVKLVRECPQTQSPLTLLIDKRGIRVRAQSVDTEMAEAIERMILEKPHRKAKRIYRYLQKDFASVPSYETVRKWINAWKKKNYLVFAFATNPDKAKGQYKPAGGSMSESIYSCNQVWELDATPADIICSDGKRYILSAAIDVYSRRPIVVVEESANYSTLAKVMRKGIKKLGVPESVKIDNGKDYTSNHFAYTCSRLRINQILCPPYSGEYKPHIERFFGTLSRELFEELDGYIGHSVSDREALQSQQMFSKKLESIKAWRERWKDGNEFARRFASKKENAGLDVGVPLSPEELQQWIDKWIIMYETRIHGGIKTKPIDKWKRDMTPKRTIEDERMLDILLGLSTMRTVQKKGINWNGVTYWSEMFGDMVGQRVWVLSDDDMASVYIYDLDMQYLFTAVNPSYENVSRSSYLAANKKWSKKLHKTIKALEQLRAEAPDRMMHQITEAIGEVPEQMSEQHRVPEIAQVEQIATLDTAHIPTEEAEIMINGRPMFTQKYDRFLWDLEHDTVDESTEKLKEKNMDIWQMAESEFHRRRAG